MSYEVVNLFDICDPKQWKTISTQELKSEGYFVYGANGIIGYYDKYTHENPTLAITCRGATCGEIHITKEFSYINGNAMALDNLSKNIDRKFLYFYFKMRKFNDVISGSAQPQITRQGLKNIQIPLPPLDIQKKIADSLDKAQELIDKRKEQISALDKFLENLFLDMFGDPVSNPMGWEVKELKEVANLERGRFSPRPRNDPTYFNGVYPFIQTGDISNSNYRLKNYTQTLNDKGIKVSKRFSKGTIVIAIVGATIGYTAILSLDVYATDSIIGITSDTTVLNNLYLEFLLRFWRNPLLENAPEVARPNINLSILGNINIVLPPLDLQNQFASIVEKVEAEKTKLEASLKKMEDNFNSIMQRAFKGELF